ncbi:Chromo-like domain superfamily [Sesbania bispinosa]|nr:Chromo-like domain superfamily [Sesbania bispinosa]
MDDGASTSSTPFPTGSFFWGGFFSKIFQTRLQFVLTRHFFFMLYPITLHTGWVLRCCVPACFMRSSHGLPSILCVTRVKDDSKMAGELVKQVGHVASDAEGKENCYIGAFIDSMAENTHMKELQNEVKHNAEDLRRLSIIVEKLEAALAAQSKSQDKKMDQIQLTLQQLIENFSQPHGSPSNSGSSLKVTPINGIPFIKDISLGFPHFDCSTPVLEWIFKADKFFNYHNTPDSDRVEIASMHFEKEVVPWFQMLQKIEAVTTWNALTRALESQFGPSPLHYSTPYNSVTRTTPKSLPAPKSTTPPLLPTPTGPPLKNTNVKRISPAEMQLRREKGLCYFCDEKFSFNHKCPNRQCLMLQLGEEEQKNEQEPTDDAVDHEQSPGDDHHLSLNALKGDLGVGTIKFKAYIGTLSVTVLIDGGSSDNFLQPRVAKFLKLPVVQAPMFRVMVGNGNYMESEGLIQDLKLQAQGNVFKLSAFLLPICGADLILGDCWLKSIGPHLGDYDTLQIKFLQGDKFTTLQGDSANLPESAQLHHIRRMINTTAIAEMYSMQRVQETSIPIPLLELPNDMEPKLALLLHTYRKENIPADALSRSFAMAWSEPVNSWLKAVADATKKDESLLHIYQKCVNNAGKFEEYTLYKDVIVRKGRIMVPNDHTLINMILAEFHASKVGGHAGTTRTSARIGAQFYWPKMRADIRKFIKECVICQQAKYLPLPLTTNEFGPLVNPVSALNSRTIVRNGKEVEQLLIKWDTLSIADNSWEDLEAMQQSYPEFNLEDKVAVKEGSIVTRVKDDSKMAGELVKQVGHVASDAEGKEVRKSSRIINKIGVVDAIRMSSRLGTIRRTEDLECLVQHWSHTTHTFYASWGEFVPSLEDVHVLMKLPLFGDCDILNCQIGSNLIDMAKELKMAMIESAKVKGTSNVLPPEQRKVPRDSLKYTFATWVCYFFEDFDVKKVFHPSPPVPIF